MVFRRFGFGTGSGLELEIEIGERDCIGELGLGRKSGERSLRGGGADGPYMRREPSKTMTKRQYARLETGPERCLYDRGL